MRDPEKKLSEVVALRYDREEDQRAPSVVARGRGEIADRIQIPLPWQSSTLEIKDLFRAVLYFLY